MRFTNFESVKTAFVNQFQEFLSQKTNITKAVFAVHHRRPVILQYAAAITTPRRQLSVFGLRWPKGEALQIAATGFIQAACPICNAK